MGLDERSPTMPAVDVRIGLVYSPRELEIEVPDDTDVAALHAEVERILAGDTGTLWLTDKKGNHVAIAGSKVTFIQIGAGSEKGRIGFG
jgi:hypothetical protein